MQVNLAQSVRSFEFKILDFGQRNFEKHGANIPPTYFLEVFREWDKVKTDYKIIQAHREVGAFSIATLCLRIGRDVFEEN